MFDEAGGFFGLASVFQLYEDDVCIGGPYVLARMDFSRPPERSSCFQSDFLNVVANGQPAPEVRQS